MQQIIKIAEAELEMYILPKLRAKFKEDSKGSKISCGADGRMSLDEMMTLAAQAIKGNDFINAKKLLRESMSLDMENPQAYNLLGIAYEKEGNRMRAVKFYRVAYYIDQTFLPAAENLDRISKILYTGCYDGQIKWGLKDRRN